MRALLLAALLLAPAAAQAYCVENRLATREVEVEQEPHPEKERHERRFRFTLKPGERRCCRIKDLDCNPTGRMDGIVAISVVIPGEPVSHCGYPEGDPDVKVTGAGSIHVQANPRYPGRSAIPHIVRVRTHDRDITGPRGLLCPLSPPKGK